MFKAIKNGAAVKNVIYFESQDPAERGTKAEQKAPCQLLSFDELIQQGDPGRKLIGAVYVRLLSASQNLRIQFFLNQITRGLSRVLSKPWKKFPEWNFLLSWWLIVSSYFVLTRRHWFQNLRLSTFNWTSNLNYPKDFLHRAFWVECFLNFQAWVRSVLRRKTLPRKTWFSWVGNKLK